MTQPHFNPYGAVDLSALASPPATTPAGNGSAGSGSFAIDVTEADFQSAVLEQSMTVPVVIDFWADWCGPCKQLSPVLERLVAADEGQWLLARIDVDANPRLGQVFQVQGIPAVFAVVKGQPIPLFQGALPEAQVRQYLDELLKVAAANGVTGRLDGAAAAEEEPFEPESGDDRYDQAYDAIERGDLDAAAAAYRSLLESDPENADARAGLAQVELMRRTAGLDEAAVRRAAAERPDDIQLAFQAADLDLLSGNVDAALMRLVGLVRRTQGYQRDRVRTHLVGLFELIGNGDDRVARARTALASALF